MRTPAWLPVSPRAPASDLSSSPTHFLQGPHGSRDSEHICTLVNPKCISTVLPPAPALPATPSWTVWAAVGGEGGDTRTSAPTPAYGPQSSAPQATPACSSRALRSFPSTPTAVFPSSEARDGCCPVIHAQPTRPFLTMPLPGSCHVVPLLFLPFVPHLQLFGAPSHSVSPTSGSVHSCHWVHNMHHRAWDTLGTQ